MEADPSRGAPTGRQRLRGLRPGRSAQHAPHRAGATGRRRLDAQPRRLRSTLANIETQLKALEPVFGDRDPHALAFSDVQEWISNCGLSPGSLRPYIATLRLVLDFAEVDPNPARDKRVRLPELEPEEISQPTAQQFLTVLDKVSKRWVLPLVVIE